MFINIWSILIKNVFRSIIKKFYSYLYIYNFIKSPSIFILILTMRKKLLKNQSKINYEQISLIIYGSFLNSSKL